MIDTIIDIYHEETVDFQAVKESRIVAIIHKATEGTNFKDPKYKERKQTAKQMGFLWGAYHFSTGRRVSDQVGNFLDQADPGVDDLIALDFEPSAGPDMTLDQAIEFIESIRSAVGRYPVLYGGGHLRESVVGRSDEVLGRCPLWYARYRSQPVGLPTHIWETFTLWQYTDGVHGPEPRTVPGIGTCDRNRFQGTTEELRTSWPFIRS